jgi:hypothetical protein
MLAKVMDAIKDDPVMLKLALQDPELSEWYKGRKKREQKKIDKEERLKQEALEKARLEQVKKDLLVRLTSDEKKALGIV